MPEDRYNELAALIHTLIQSNEKVNESIVKMSSRMVTLERVQITAQDLNASSERMMGTMKLLLEMQEQKSREYADKLNAQQTREIEAIRSDLRVENEKGKPMGELYVLVRNSTVLLIVGAILGLIIMKQ